MSDPKHFHYDGNVHLKNGKQLHAPARPPRVTGLEFMTPAKLTVVADGEEITQWVNVDIINRKVYTQGGNLWMSDEVFAFLDSSNNLPDDFYAASDELHEQVADIDGDRIRKQEELLGESHE